MDECVYVFRMFLHVSVFLGVLCCYFGFQCPDQEELSLRKTPHPPKPPHVPFSCLHLLRSHDPLTKASSSVEYHMFVVKSNFFFSSLKTSLCQAKSIEKDPHPPTPPTLYISQNISNRWGFKSIWGHNKRAQHFNNIVSNFKSVL